MSNAITVARKMGEEGLTRAQAGLELIRDLVVQDVDSQEFAADVLQGIKAEHGALEEKRKTLTVPMNEALRAANDLFRPAREVLEECEKLLKGKIAGYLGECEARNRAALEAAAAAGSSEEASEALAQHEVVDAPQGVSVRHVWRFEVVDAALVPAAFLGPDPAKIDVYLQKAKDQAEIPGVRFFKEPIVTSRKRK